MHTLPPGPAFPRVNRTAIFSVVFAGLLIGGELCGVPGGGLTGTAWAQAKSEATKSLRVGKLSPGMVSLAGLTAIQEELGVSFTPEAAANLSEGELLQRLSASMSAEFQNELQIALNKEGQSRETAEEDPVKRRQLNALIEKLRAEMNAKYYPLLQQVLTEAQIVRLRQIHWQLMGSSALQEPELIEVIKLSNQQINRIRTTLAEAQSRIGEAANTPFAGGGIERGGYGEMQRRIANIEAERDRQLNDLLTPEQRNAWADSLGKPFDRRKLTTAVAPPKQTERSKPKTRSSAPKTADPANGPTLGDRPNSSKRPTAK
ncbi:MAG: hypothetical protein ACKOGA_04760 [Planctomycetaceae bacterium]